MCVPRHHLSACRKRHQGRASILMLRAGVHPKVVSERLGHATVGLTLDTYSHVLPNLQRDAAEVMESVLRPRTRRPATGATRNFGRQLVGKWSAPGPAEARQGPISD